LNKTIIISNRLPVTVEKNAKGELEYIESLGGLSTGLKSIHGKADSLWVGWPGISDEELTEEEKAAIKKTLSEKYKCLPVFLTSKEVNLYYHGFCNKTIWPLFHYFMEKTEYDFSTWEAYKRVNEKFFESAAQVTGEDDVVWVHDYQLMLLPEMIKTANRKAQVGFFLHIPFPSVEIFKLLIWRKEILLGILGADLIGFHTYDYARHFLSCTRRLLGLEDNLNKVAYEERYVEVDAFPMGIDYERFFMYSGEEELSDENDLKTILSVDRLDYTKGILGRLKAFGKFLQYFPEYQGKVVLKLIVAPSREKVEYYDKLLREIEEQISKINGQYGTMTWMPVWFFYRSFSQESLTELYRKSEVLLVTPVRDGMNLVSKEYIASRNDYNGMVVISETAGASSELGEAIVVNANDYYSTAKGIKSALEMPEDEKITRNRIMHNRLKRYNVDFWAEEFLRTLNRIVADSREKNEQKNAEEEIEIIKKDYSKAKTRILYLDYDGTLVDFVNIPEQAKPDERLKSILMKLTSDPRNTVVIVSGRDREVLSRWLGELNLNLLASHGLWLKNSGEDDWSMMVPLDNVWKDSVRNILQLYTDSTPGSFIEEKEFSLAWHYRQCDPDMAALKLREMRETLRSMTQSSLLGLQEGNKVLEVKDTRFNKGYGALQFLQNQSYDFILGIGDDRTDEDLFSTLPEHAYTIKVGLGNTDAEYMTKSWQSVRRILEELISSHKEVDNE